MASIRWQNGSTRAWRKVRARILERDGYRCTHVDEGGERCEATERLEVHHTKAGPVLDTTPDSDLVTVCRPHHPKPKGDWKRAAADALDEQRASIAKLELVEIPIGDLRAAPWNANRTPRATVARIKKSFERFGIVENSIVRPLEQGGYELLSGNHRLKVYKQLALETVPCKIVNLDDAQARLLAQTINRQRGKDDPHRLEQLIDEILAGVDRAQVEELLGPVLALPVKVDAPVTELEEVTKRFRPQINPVKLGMRMEAVCHIPRPRLRRALELFAGEGQLSRWYARVFDEVVRVDVDHEGRPTFQMKAADYITERLIADGPFDLIDLDDSGSPHAELDALFTVLAEAKVPPFVLCVTDGLAVQMKLHPGREIDLMERYRWPAKGKDRRIYLKLPQLLDHGVKARAAAAGYEAELIAADWKPGKSQVYGSWTIGPVDDTRDPLEQAIENEPAPPEAYGCWRVALKES